jgi:hypothetical protein
MEHDNNIFVSYSHNDREFVERVILDLRNEGFQVWVDQEKLTPGTPDWEESIRTAVDASFATLLVATPESKKSAVVRSELLLAEARKRPIYPVWAKGDIWIDSIPLAYAHSQYVDCRGDRYGSGMNVLISKLKKDREPFPGTQPERTRPQPLSMGIIVPETLIDRLRAGRVIPVVGAGVSETVIGRTSRRHLYPNWQELLRHAADRLRAEQKEPHANLVSNLIEIGKPEDYLDAARRAFDGLGPSWYDFLREQFGYPKESVDDGSLELARMIWRLGSRIVVTTTYDKVLHWACEGRDNLLVWDVEPPADQVSFLKGELDRPIVWHLYGHVGNLADVILTPDGYSRLYLHDVRSDVSFEAALNTLRYQLSSHSFLFLGFSFNETHLSAQLRQLEEISEGTTGPHFVLLRKAEAKLVNSMRQFKAELVIHDDHTLGLEMIRELISVAGLADSPAPKHASPTVLSTATPVVAVRIPPFHYGSVVPLDFFIDRELELERAQELIATRQSFLIVGRRRAGKTSFGQKLIHSVMASGVAARVRVLGSYLDLQQYSILDVDRFLAHTLLNMIGEVARQVFCCKYTTLSRKNPFDLHPELLQDVAFKDLLELYHEVEERTHTQGRTTPSELRPDEFERFIADLIEIVRNKNWSDMFIFYDEANRLPLDLSVEFLTWNVEALNRAGIVSIYAASPEMAEKFNPWSDREIRIGPFLNVEDMLRLLAKYYFGDISLKVDLPVAREAIVRIWEFSLGIPYIIQHISGRSFSCASKEGSKRVEERHVRAAYEELRNKKPEVFHH